jgi:hypothetical protein
MGFLNAGLMGLLALGTVPIVIHLLNRRRYTVVKFAAMEFLLRAQVKTRQRLRMENLLLLIVRTLAVLLFVVAAMRPFLPTAGAAGLLPDSKHLYLLIDNSASMGYREGMTPLLQRSVREAHEAVRALRRDDPVTLVVTCDEQRRRNGRPLALLRATRDHEKVHEILDRIPLSNARMDPAASLAEVLSVAEPGDPTRRLLVFSDFQRGDWDPDGTVEAGTEPTAPGDAAAGGMAALQAQFHRLQQARFSFLLLAPPTTDIEDVGVLAVEFTGGRPPAEGLAGGVQVTVANHGSASTTVVVSLAEVDGRERRERGSQRVTLKGRPLRSPRPETARVEFTWSGSAGSHFLEATVEATGNRLKVNDRRGHAFVVRDRVKVLSVDGDPNPGPGRWPETRLLNTALRLSRGVMPVDLASVPEHDLSRAPVEDQDVVVLANPGPLPDAQWERLAAWVRRGGGLMVFLGDRTDPREWNRVAARANTVGLLPARLAARPRLDEDAPVAADLSESSHPVLKDLTDPRYGTSFESSLVAGWWPVEAPLEEGTEVVQHLTDLDRSPLWLERRFGRGRVLLCTSTADLDWTGPSLIFAPFVQEAVAYLAAGGEPRRDLIVHQALSREVPLTAQQIVVTDPSGQVHPPLEAVLREDPDVPGLNTAAAVFPGTALAGRYRLAWRAPVTGEGLGASLQEYIEEFAVDIHDREGDPGRMTREELERRHPDALVVAEGGMQVADEVRSASGPSGDLTSLFIGAGALMLLVETFMAAAFGRKRG